MAIKLRHRAGTYLYQRSGSLVIRTLPSCHLFLLFWGSGTGFPQWSISMSWAGSGNSLNSSFRVSTFRYELQALNLFGYFFLSLLIVLCQTLLRLMQFHSPPQKSPLTELLQLPSPLELDKDISLWLHKKYNFRAIYQSSEVCLVKYVL